MKTQDIARYITALLIVFFFPGCQTYTSLELAPERILDELEMQRSRKVISGKIFDFSQAARIMSQNNLTLKALEESYKRRKMIAELKTAWPNPSLEIGAAFGSNLDAPTLESSTQPFISLGFSFPLGPRLRKNDDLDKLLAIQAYNQLIIKHRTLYFQLREAFINYSLSRQLLEAQERINKTLILTRKTTEKLVELGSSTKLGLTILDIQHINLDIQTLQQKIDIETDLRKLSSLLMTQVSDFTALPIQTLPDINRKNPLLEKPLVQLKRQLLHNNLRLAEIEMTFHITDAELLLELSKQYPDLTIGLGIDNEVGEKKRNYILPFSLNLPLFDRNQKGIAQALRKRRLKLAQYKTELSELITRLEEEYRKFILNRKKLALFVNQLMPLAEKNLQDAQKALSLGSINILRYFDFVVTYQQSIRKKLLLEQESWAQLIKLEMLTGHPFLNLKSQELNPLKTELKKIKQP